MVVMFGQIIFLKPRRICQIFMAILFVVIIFYLYPGQSSLSSRSIFGQESKVIGRPDLAKYIHIDLKGAPPKAEQFYPTFFQFLDNLQMGVKGVLIEYEDTLPLEGNLLNARIKSTIN